MASETTGGGGAHGGGGGGVKEGGKPSDRCKEVEEDRRECGRECGRELEPEKSVRRKLRGPETTDGGYGLLSVRLGPSGREEMVA